MADAYVNHFDELMGTKNASLLINLSNHPEPFILKVISAIEENQDIFPIYRGAERYTVKYSFPSCGIANIEVKVLRDCYGFSVKQDGGILFASKPTIPTFYTELSLGKNNKLKVHKLPKDREAVNWLYTRMSSTVSGATNFAEYLVIVATVCTMIWSQFVPAMKIRTFGTLTEFAPRDDWNTFIDEYARNMRIKHKDEHATDGWDTVRLTNEQFSKIGKTLADNGIPNDSEHVALAKFCLAIRGKDTDYYYFDRNDNKLHVEIDRSTARRRASFDVIMMPNGRCKLESSNTDKVEAPIESLREKDGTDVAYWEWLITIYVGIQTFMIHYGDVSFDVEEKTATARSEYKPQKKQERNTVRLFKCYTLKKAWKNAVRKKAVITCPAWGVKGHFRHYKSGKVVFINPFVKGKEKDNYKGKDYNLIPYSEM